MEKIVKIWSDWNGCIRKKLAHNNLESRATGGGPFNKHILSNSEECIAGICGILAAVDDIQDARSFGPETSFNASEVEEESPQTNREAIVTPIASRLAQM